MQLQPQQIADCYTLAEINIEITAIKAAITIARQSSRDKFGDTQAQQDITRQTLKDLMEELAVYISAKNILNETDSSTAGLINVNYNPSVPRI